MRSIGLFLLLLHSTLACAQGISSNRWIQVIPRNSDISGITLEKWVDEWYDRGNQSVLVVVFRKNSESLSDFVKNKMLFDCLPPTMSEAVDLKVVQYDGDDIRVEIVASEGGSFLPRDFRRSFALVFSRDDWSKYLTAKETSLGLINTNDLREYDDLFFSKWRGLTVHELSTEFVLMEREEVSHDDQFCWSLQRLNWLISDSEEEIVRMGRASVSEMVEKRKPITRLMVSIPTHADLKVDGGFIDGLSMQSRRGLSLQFPLNDADSAGLGFQFYGGMAFGISSAISSIRWDDASLELDVLDTSSPLNGMVVDQFGIVERMAFSSLTDISFPLSVVNGLDDEKSCFLITTLRPGLISGGVAYSELIGGEFSYAGIVDGVNDLIENSPVLGLENGVDESRFESQYLPYNGYTVGASIELYYLGDKFGLGCGIFGSRMWLDSVGEGSVAGTSEEVGQYSSIFSTEGISWSQRGFRFSLLYSVGE